MDSHKSHKKTAYIAPMVELFCYTTEEGFASSTSESGFVDQNGAQEAIDLMLMNNGETTNRGERYHEITTNGFGSDDDFWVD